jgi:hypothetical protein
VFLSLILEFLFLERGGGLYLVLLMLVKNCETLLENAYNCFLKATLFLVLHLWTLVYPSAKGGKSLSFLDPCVLR